MSSAWWFVGNYRDAEIGGDAVLTSPALFSLLQLFFGKNPRNRCCEVWRYRAYAKGAERL